MSKNKESAGAARSAAEGEKEVRRKERRMYTALPLGLLLYHTTIKTQPQSPEWLAFLSAPQLPTVGRIHP